MLNKIEAKTLLEWYGLKNASCITTSHAGVKHFRTCLLFDTQVAIQHKRDADLKPDNVHLKNTNNSLEATQTNFTGTNLECQHKLNKIK